MFFFRYFVCSDPRSTKINSGSNRSSETGFARKNRKFPTQFAKFEFINSWANIVGNDLKQVLCKVKCNVTQNINPYSTQNVRIFKYSL